MRRVLAAAALLAGVAAGLPNLAVAGAGPDSPARVVSCAECGMKAKVDNRFTSRLAQGGSTRYFCDIGALAVFLGRTSPKQYVAEVRDFTSGEWVDAATALYVIRKETFLTPMGWGVAAFRDRSAAGGSVLDFEALRKALAQ